MKLWKLLSVAGIASIALAGPASASEKWVYTFTCNSDGFVHVHIWNGFAWAEAVTKTSCGPIAVGHGFKLELAEKRMVSPNGQAFLNALEKGGTIAQKRVPAPGGSASPARMDGLESMQMAPSDVGPRLAALLTSITPGWRTEGNNAPKASSIFDRWGNRNKPLREPLREPTLVPGDMRLTIAAGPGEADDKRNAKERCLDKHGFWRERPAGEWGCWTTAK